MSTSDELDLDGSDPESPCTPGFDGSGSPDFGMNSDGITPMNTDQVLSADTLPSERAISDAMTTVITPRMNGAPRSGETTDGMSMDSVIIHSDDGIGSIEPGPPKKMTQSLVDLFAMEIISEVETERAERASKLDLLKVEADPKHASAPSVDMFVNVEALWMMTGREMAEEDRPKMFGLHKSEPTPIREDGTSQIGQQARHSRPRFNTSGNRTVPYNTGGPTATRHHSKPTWGDLDAKSHQHFRKRVRNTLRLVATEAFEL